jgi:hypothetical protein
VWRLRFRFTTALLSCIVVYSRLSGPRHPKEIGTKHMNGTFALLIAKAAFGASLALSFAAMPHAVAHTGYDAYAAEVGDDNADGIITEDESGWDCRVMGNRICGPDAVLPDGSIAVPGDYTTVHPDGTPAWPTGEYA